MGESVTGLLVVASDLEPIYANAEAVRILAYPETAKSIKGLDSFLAHRIRSALLHHENGTASRNGDHSLFAAEFPSGRRRYLCRVFALNSHSDNSQSHPVLAIIFERRNGRSFDTSEVAARYRLTLRERETLQYLMQGLTNKEIGQRMNISPNTVKAFVKLIMTKMDVATRSAVIGRTVGSDPERRIPLVASASYNPFG